MKPILTLGGVWVAVAVSGCTTAETVDSGPLAGTKLLMCSYALPISQCQDRAVEECPNGYRAVKYSGSINGKKMYIRCTDDHQFINDETAK
ncbi:hypothetical protein [Paraburkholderia sp. PGU19]|uniref:hypothetical protein n=1 Tax=Paraburkholderia sp. PGU19 TaxID=2735434 RepID=UPI0015D98841|nr:hypothetical protein [Paraburkholderia sp. PGU19]